ncbi:hypothetical protein FACS189415_4310 [Bacteroidia bacterium]|nr:hypothetical protein FACS189415_4310 [Bacteroidia bacterium]
MAVSLYTSRVVLSVLGVDDFGLSVVITSVVAMFDFINHSMAVSTSRFFTYELGKNDFEKLRKTFSASFTVHIIIAIIIIILCETIGLWYLENKMIIPEGRMTAARWVYQLSLIGAFIAIIQSPFDALIISHEKMNVYAYIGILNSCLKLAIVYLLIFGNFDKLIFYAILTLCVTVVIALFYICYCIKKFQECKYCFEWDKTTIYPILSFSGWNLYSIIGSDTKDKGVNIILNLFFTTAVNAAFGLAVQVNTALSALYHNFMMAVKPQLVKYYAENRISEMNHLAVNATKYSFILCFIPYLPIMVEIDFILNIWLKNVPEYVNVFCLLFLITGLLNTFWGAINYVVYATSKIRKISFVIGTIYLFIPVISYFLFKFNYKIVYAPLLINIIVSIVVTFIVLLKVHSLIPQFSIFLFIKKSIISNIIVSAISAILPLFIHFSMAEGWLRLILVILSSTIMIAISTYYILFDRQTRISLIGFISNKIRK